MTMDRTILWSTGDKSNMIFLISVGGFYTVESLSMVTTIVWSTGDKIKRGSPG